MRLDEIPALLVSLGDEWRKPGHKPPEFEQAASVIRRLLSENDSLKRTVRLHQLTDDRYYELLSRARRVYRYHGVNSVLLDASISDLDALIQRHNREIDDEECPE